MRTCIMLDCIYYLQVSVCEKVSKVLGTNLPYPL